MIKNASLNPPPRRPAQPVGARTLAGRLRGSPLTVLCGPIGATRSNALRDGVMPLLQRRASDSPIAFEAGGAVVLPFPDRRGAARAASGHAVAGAGIEVAVLLDNWLGQPLAEFHTQLGGLLCIAPLRVIAAGPTLAAQLQVLAERFDVRFLLICDRFEDALRAAEAPGGCREFVDELTAVLRAPQPAAHVLLSVSDDALPLLNSFGQRLPALDSEPVRLATDAADSASASPPPTDSPPPPPTEPQRPAMRLVPPAPAGPRTTAVAPPAADAAAPRAPAPAAVDREWNSSIESILARIASTAARPAAGTPPADDAGLHLGEDDPPTRPFVTDAEPGPDLAGRDVVDLPLEFAPPAATTEPQAPAEPAPRAESEPDGPAEPVPAPIALQTSQPGSEPAAEPPLAADSIAPTPAAVARAVEPIDLDAASDVEPAATAVDDTAPVAETARLAVPAHTITTDRPAAAQPADRPAAATPVSPVSPAASRVDEHNGGSRRAWAAATLVLASAAVWWLWPTGDRAGSTAPVAAVTPAQPAAPPATRTPATTPPVVRDAEPTATAQATPAPQAGTRDAAPQIAAAPPVATPPAAAPSAVAPPFTAARAVVPSLPSLVLAVDGDDGGAARLAGDLAQLVGLPAGIGLQIEPAAGWADALAAPRDGQRLAVARYDALAAMRRESPGASVRLVTPLVSEELYFIARADSPLAHVHDIERATRINIGPAQGGRAVTAQTVYQRLFDHPMLAGQTSFANRDAALHELLVTRAVDVIVFADPQPSSWLARLPAAQLAAIKLLPLVPDHPTTLRARRTYLPAVLHAGASPVAAETPTLSVMSFLVATGDSGGAPKRGAANSGEEGATPGAVPGSSRSGTAAQAAGGGLIARLSSGLCRNLERLRRDGHPKWQELQPGLPLPAGWPYAAEATAAFRQCGTVTAAAAAASTKTTTSRGPADPPSPSPAAGPAGADAAAAAAPRGTMPKGREPVGRTLTPLTNANQRGAST